jgi:hypothetical protein
MTGPEHYREAEWLLQGSTDVNKYDPPHRVVAADASPEVIAVAQVHATLALAAATVSLPADLGADVTDDWQAVLS